MRTVLQFAGLQLAEGLAKAGQRELASSTICEAVTWAETRGRILNFIDLLRVKGEILNLMMPVVRLPFEQALCECVSCQLLAALIRSATISAIKMTVGLVATDGTSGIIEASPA